MASTQPLTKDKIKQCIKREDRWCEIEQKLWVESTEPYVISSKEKKPTQGRTLIRSFEHYKTGNYLFFLLSEIKKQEKEQRKKEKQAAPQPVQPSTKSVQSLKPVQPSNLSQKKPVKSSGPQVFYVSKKPKAPLMVPSPPG